jgi:hypothetical protein
MSALMLYCHAAAKLLIHTQNFVDSCKAHQSKSSKTPICRYRKKECIQVHSSLIINYLIILKLIFLLEQTMKTQKGIEV